MQTVTPKTLAGYHTLWADAPEDEPWEVTQERADALFDAMLACPDWRVSGWPPGYTISLGHLALCAAKSWQGDKALPWQAFASSIRGVVTVMETLKQLGASDGTLWWWVTVAQDPDRLGLVQALVEVFDCSWGQN